MDVGNWMQQPDILRELAAAGGLGAAAAAQKQFIMFDKSGDRGRIMFSPTQFYELPASQTAAAAGDDEAGDTNQAANFQHVYQEAMASFAALQSLRESSRPFSITLFDINNNSEDTDCSSKLSWDHHQASAAPVEEDSEDIDALLDSDYEEDDEECSTGHSPSGVTCDDCDDEVASEFPKSGARAGTVRGKTVRGESPGGGSSSSSGFYDQKKKPLVNLKKVMKKKRKEKIRSTVKALQSLIPGGDNLDSAAVLDEAIRYMKVLQMKVVQLEASRQVKL